MGVHALIVDDSPVTRKVMRRMLKVVGLTVDEVSEASDGAEALALASGGVNLLLTDLHMPNMDGEQLLDALADRGLLRDMGVIVCTSDRSGARHAALRARGANACIVKPFGPEALRDALVRLPMFASPTKEPG